MTTEHFLSDLLMYWSQFVDSVNEVLWGSVLMYGLVAVGLFFTIYLGAPQFIRFGPAVRQVFGKLYKYQHTDRDGKSISSFQALAVAISAQVGTGNVAGVATAIMAGGPGAIFWMWLSALFGMSTIFAEAVLAQKYRVEVSGKFIGGPAFYISRGLQKYIGQTNAKIFAGIFAVIVIISVGFIGSMAQSNSIATAVNNAFGISPVVCGVLIALFAGAIFIGGIHRIARFAQLIVPMMAAVYILCAIVILFLFAEHILPMIQHIVIGAFNPQALGGGLLGVTMKEAVRFGVARGLFSNEAGMGTTPHAHATALVAHPVLQGFTAFIGVFVDTILVCTSTALIILLTGADQLGLDGAMVTQEAFHIAFGAIGPKIIAICLTFFAFTTVISWYYFGESNVRYLFKSNAVLYTYRALVLVFIVLGTLGTVDLIWSMIDMFNGIMVLPNLIALIILHKEVKGILRDYDKKRQDGIPLYDYDSVA